MLLLTLICVLVLGVLMFHSCYFVFSLLFQVLNKPYMMKIHVVQSEISMIDIRREVSNFVSSLPM
jgi:hypothetical protein